MKCATNEKCKKIRNIHEILVFENCFPDQVHKHRHNIDSVAVRKIHVASVLPAAWTVEDVFRYAHRNRRSKCVSAMLIVKKPACSMSCSCLCVPQNSLLTTKHDPSLLFVRATVSQCCTARIPPEEVRADPSHSKSGRRKGWALSKTLEHHGEKSSSSLRRCSVRATQVHEPTVPRCVRNCAQRNTHDPLKDLHHDLLPRTAPRYSCVSTPVE